MSNNQIPERVINFNVYRDGTNKLIGVAESELPEVTGMSDTVSGAGIAGEYEAVTLGAFESMEWKITFRTLTKEALALVSMKSAHKLTGRAAIQVQDAVTGETKVVPMVLSATVKTKVFNLGGLEPSAAQDIEYTGEVLQMRVRLDDQEYLEIDKQNFVFKVNGIDELKAVRDAI